MVLQGICIHLSINLKPKRRNHASQKRREEKMGAKGWFILKLLMFQGLFVSRPQEDFDFFYLVLQVSTLT